jgi:hypothetical protein
MVLPQLLGRRTGRVHQRERIAMVDHSLVPFHRGIEIQRVEVKKHAAPARQWCTPDLLQQLFGASFVAAVPERGGEKPMPLMR